MEQWKTRLEAPVADGTITQEQADAMLARVTECMASCDGTGCGNGRQWGGCGSQGQCGRNSGNGRRGGQGCGRRA